MAEPVCSFSSDYLEAVVLIIIKFVSCPPTSVPILSMQETLGAESMPDSTLSFVEMLLPVLLGLLKGLNLSQGDAYLRKHCLRISYVTSLLLNILHVTLQPCSLSLSAHV